MDALQMISQLLAEGEREYAKKRRAERSAQIAAAPKKVVAGVTFVERRVTQEPHRGHMVLVKGKRDPQIVTKYEWKRGARIVPRGSTATSPRDGQWVKLETITHLAIKTTR